MRVSKPFEKIDKTLTLDTSPLYQLDIANTLESVSNLSSFAIANELTEMIE